MTYLYIFEDGVVQVHPTGPTAGDLHMIDEGLLTVIQCTDPMCINEKGKSVKLTRCGFGIIDRNHCHYQS